MVSGTTRTYMRNEIRFPLKPLCLHTAIILMYMDIVDLRNIFSPAHYAHTHSGMCSQIFRIFVGSECYWNILCQNIVMKYIFDKITKYSLLCWQQINTHMERNTLWLLLLSRYIQLAVIETKQRNRFNLIRVPYILWCVVLRPKPLFSKMRNLRFIFRGWVTS